MHCEHCQSLLIDHAHAELAPAEHAEVTRHLAHCPACAVASCRLRADLEGLLQATSEAPPPALRARLRREVERSFRPSWRRRALATLARPAPATEGPPRLSGYDAAAPLRLHRPIL